MNKFVSYKNETINLSMVRRFYVSKGDSILRFDFIDDYAFFEFKNNDLAIKVYERIISFLAHDFQNMFYLDHFVSACEVNK